MAHRRCLGASDEDWDFKCATCTLPETTHTCMVCYVSDKGLYTKILGNNGESKWIHQICGLLCDDYQVPDIETMEFTFNKATKLEEAKLR